MLGFYRDLIALRAAEPDLRDSDLTRVRVDYDEDERWVVVHRGALRVAANLADAEQDVSVPGAAEVVFATSAVSVGAAQVRLPAQSAAVLRTGFETG
jgi:maltooligosyltrehalose trehalohydrolase